MALKLVPTFFYLMPLGPGNRPGLLRVRNGAGWEGEIEEEFLKPVIKSPRECQSILVKPTDLKYKIFICNKLKKELKGTNALRYIEWGETTDIEIMQGKDKGKTIRGFHRLESIKNRKQWWTVYAIYGNTFWGKELRERLASFVLEELIMADCRLYCAKIPIEIQLFCNSTVYHLIGEATKRDIGGGGGPRSVMIYEIKDSIVMKVSGLNKNNFLNSRYLKTIFEECGIGPTSDTPIAKQDPNPLPDRAELDKIVFDALDLSEEERTEVYRAVCLLVWNRISKAKSLKKRR